MHLHCQHLVLNTKGLMAITSLAERFWKKVDVREPDECWPWLASTRLGYGQITAGRRGEGVLISSRVAWELTHGPIPKGLNVCHRCDNPKCCNRAHLFLGTQKNNMADAAQKGRISRSHQKKGVEHHDAKLTEDDVRAIRVSPKQQRDIAREFGISQANVYYIRARKTWTHVA